MPMRLILFAFSFLLLASGVKAEYFTIKNFQVTVNFTDEGYANFDETIEVEFSEPRHGIFQFIPYKGNVQDKEVSWAFKDINVEGYNYTTSKENDNIVIKIGDADVLVEGRQVYHITFTVLNTLNFFENNTELYWDILGIHWTTDIENFSFDLKFPDKVQLTTNDVRVFTGQEGSKGQDAELQVFPNEVKGKTTRVFTPGEGVTVAVNFPADTFQPMGALTSFWQIHGLLIAPIFFLLAAFFAKFFARNRKQPIMTEYFPPDGVSPVIAGGFIDNSVDNNDVLSLIPHLANKGYLRLESKEEKGFFKNKNNITFYKLKEAGSDLMVFETQFFNALFSTGSLVELSDLKDKFYTQLASVKESVRAWIKAQGWYSADQRAFGCVTGIVGLIALAWGAYALFAKQNVDGIALIVSAFIIFFISSRFHKRTPAGNETYQKLEGFRQFVSKAERPIIERLMKEDPLYYDKTMPYALAFGYLSQWNKQFEGLLTQPPSWYTGPMMYGSGMNQSWNTFSESFPSEISNIGSVFGSSPSSSSGGGGGGGFSGGGGGGGGGGSW
ncbi:MAG: DUF2207 domain-containing protein [Saprospiraceae bacterium]|uniref:DUF2207 domain-containing protein n=1 Tax=Candidatus Opimibacter skivensis TaxID=2982028 RepID=A0A9D7XLT3_9BACT|nr:DUF2207 domain-containing protein [Candidatus Opimibacter skivensis]